jgi:hypothetical protein
MNKSSKFQAPTSREHQSAKLHTATMAERVTPCTDCQVDSWCLELLWSLDVGAWSFHSNALGPVGAVTVFSAGFGFLGFVPRNV